MVSDPRESDDDQIYEVFSDNEVILTWRPAKPVAPKREEQDRDRPRPAAAGEKVAEGAGFEPACGLRHGGFQVHCLAS